MQCFVLHVKITPSVFCACRHDDEVELLNCVTQTGYLYESLMWVAISEWVLTASVGYLMVFISVEK